MRLDECKKPWKGLFDLITEEFRKTNENEQVKKIILPPLSMLHNAGLM